MLNKRLKELREKHGYTQKELGARIGVNDNTITNYEKGIRQPSYEILENIATVFDCSTDYLLGRTNNPKETLVPPEQGQRLIGMAKDANVSLDELEAYIEARKKAQNIKGS
jgi:transcriptional regulator with XRE-family HTH domain